MIVDINLLDMQRRALSVIVVDNQLPNITQREDLEGLLELLHSIHDVYLETNTGDVILEMVDG